jgi:predicted RNA-binding protein (virulence factor B family)
MINIGKINQLSVIKQQGANIYLGSAVSNKVLLVDKKPPANCQVGDHLTVFVYIDNEGHLAATTTLPFAQVDDIAYLKVAALNYVGAFLDWGLAKNLLVPFSEQLHELEVGKFYLVKVFLDDQQRVVATTKIDKFISDTADEQLSEGQQVEILIADKTELGVKAIINNCYWGMLYSNELFQPVKKGQKLSAYIKHIRDDFKIDLSLQIQGYVNKVLPLTDNILNQLKANNGVLAISDKSPPEEIYATFGVSKKVFKQAIGALYKQQKISIEKTEIRLL